MDELTEAGITVSKFPNQGEDYFQQRIREPYLDSLITNLEKRFDDKCALAAFDIFNPSKLTCLPEREDSVQTVLEYGVQEVKELAKQYAGVVPDY